MARTYSSRLTALTIGADPRWVDNLLSRHTIPGVSKGRRGIERRISEEALLHVELIRMLNLELGVSLESAVVIARALAGKTGYDAPNFETPSGLRLSAPLDAIIHRLRTRLAESVEYVAQVPRGRRPRV